MKGYVKQLSFIKLFFIISFEICIFDMESQFIGEINYIIMCIYFSTSVTLTYHTVREMHPREIAAILHGRIHE